MRTPLLLTLAFACNPGSMGKGGDGAAAVSDGESGTPVDSGAPADPRRALEMAAPAPVHTARVASADVCAECHSNADGATAMRLADGTAVGPHDLQHGSVMANAARDPLFFAVLAAETALAPDAASDIEGVCFRCHAPLAVAEAGATGAALPSAAVLRMGDGDAATAGREGVGCVACHRMADDGLETPERWTGRFAWDTRGQVFGPHAAPFTHPMETHTGWLPAEGPHVVASRLCASCHTLQTHTLVDGAFTEHTFLEQATWLEWRASAFGDGGAQEQSCQGCHMPTLEASGEAIQTRIARRPDGGDFPPIDARAPYGRHDQVGGNTLLLRLLRDNADVLRPRADAARLDAAIGRTRAMLASAASVELVDVERTTGGLRARIRIRNQTGHKLPTGYPSRRAWLRVRVLDADGGVVWSVGEVDDRGRIVDAAGAPLVSESVGGPAPHHVEAVGDGGPPPIYGVTMLDAGGHPTWRLLPAATLARDTRLLPVGWDTAATDTEVGSIAPVGTDEDRDFLPGGDDVELVLSGLAGPAPHRVEAALLHQTLAPRFLAELREGALPEVAALDAMLTDALLAPELLGEDQAEVP